MQSALVIFYAKFSSFGRHHGQLEFQRSAACRTNHARDNLRHQIVPAGQCNELIDIDSARPCPTMRGRRTVPPSTSGNILDMEPFPEQGSTRRGRRAVTYLGASGSMGYPATRGSAHDPMLR
jgi:hypothetical protein